MNEKKKSNKLEGIEANEIERVQRLNSITENIKDVEIMNFQMCVKLESEINLKFDKNIHDVEKYANIIIEQAQKDARKGLCFNDKDK
jgi:hypothetical protein